MHHVSLASNSQEQPVINALLPAHNATIPTTTFSARPVLQATFWPQITNHVQPVHLVVVLAVQEATVPPVSLDTLTTTDPVTLVAQDVPPAPQTPFVLSAKMDTSLVELLVSNVLLGVPLVKHQEKSVSLAQLDNY